MGSTAYTTKVLITGANTGLGWQIAKKLPTEHNDYHIIMSGRKKDAIEKAKQSRTFNLRGSPTSSPSC
ncbi:MAG: hypothetical protein JWP34_5006 [Massilia sp.]|nr:hypothetical protein [Massilia sp.]